MGARAGREQLDVSEVRHRSPFTLHPSSAMMYRSPVIRHPSSVSPGPCSLCLFHVSCTGGPRERPRAAAESATLAALIRASCPCFCVLCLFPASCKREREGSKQQTASVWRVWPPCNLEPCILPRLLASCSRLARLGSWPASACFITGGMQPWEVHLPSMDNGCGRTDLRSALWGYIDGFNFTLPRVSITPVCSADDDGSHFGGTHRNWCPVGAQRRRSPRARCILEARLLILVETPFSAKAPEPSPSPSLYGQPHCMGFQETAKCDICAASEASVPSENGSH